VTNNTERTEVAEPKICRNPNHPKKGSITKVEPIKNEKDIRLIKKLLSDNPRNLAIFTIGINTNLRASDLLRITIGHVIDTNIGEKFSIREKKTGKVREIIINKNVHEAVHGLLKTMDTSNPSSYLFQSRVKKNGGKLTEECLNALVKSWCREINLKGQYGSHTLRKVFGYFHRTRFGTDIPTLMTLYGHSTQRQTLSYLCITEQDVSVAMMQNI